MKKIIKVMIAMCTVLAASFMTTSCFFFKVDDDETVNKDGMQLVWSDEFDYSGVPGTTDWKYQTGKSGWGNNELQNYIDNSTVSADNTAIVEDGHLKIRAYYKDGEWKSARLNTKKSWKYGYIEARMKVTDQRGAWPAFWMMPTNFNDKTNPWPDCGEIDIMENAPYVVGKSNYCFSSLHAKGHYGEHPESIGNKTFSGSLKDEWHTFGLQWDEKKISAVYDGEVVGTYYNDNTGKNNWPYNTDFYIILNLAIGGNLGGTPAAASLQGSDVEFLIDYVRVYQ